MLLLAFCVSIVVKQKWKSKQRKPDRTSDDDNDDGKKSFRHKINVRKPTIKLAKWILCVHSVDVRAYV